MALFEIQNLYVLVAGLALLVFALASCVLLILRLGLRSVGVDDKKSFFVSSAFMVLTGLYILKKFYPWG